MDLSPIVVWRRWLKHLQHSHTHMLSRRAHTPEHRLLSASGSLHAHTIHTHAQTHTHAVSLTYILSSSLPSRKSLFSQRSAESSSSSSSKPEFWAHTRFARNRNGKARSVVPWPLVVCTGGRARDSRPHRRPYATPPKTRGNEPRARACTTEHERSKRKTRTRAKPPNGAAFAMIMK